MKHIMYSAIAGMVLAGCVNNEAPSTTNSQLPSARLRLSDTPNLEGELKPDETAIRSLRRSFVKNESVPTHGKDVRLIITDGMITLRGVVGSEQEKISIDKLARECGGPKRIDNQLKVASSIDRVAHEVAVGSWFFQ